MQTFNLSIVTPDSTLFEGEVVAAILPGVEGFFEILANHAPIIAMVKNGTIQITDQDEKNSEIEIEEGFFEFSHNKGILLTMPQVQK